MADEISGPVNSLPSESVAAAVQALQSLPAMVQAINQMNRALTAVLPVVQTVSTTATAGTSGAVPAQVLGYLNVTLPDGSAARVPYFSP